MRLNEKFRQNTELTFYNCHVACDINHTSSGNWPDEDEWSRDGWRHGAEYDWSFVYSFVRSVCTRSTCPKIADDMSTICRRHVQNLQTTCLKFADDMCEICRRHVQKQTTCPKCADDMSTICRRHVQELQTTCPKFQTTCLKFADDMSKICRRHVQNLQTTCPKLFCLLTENCNPRRLSSNWSTPEGLVH